MLNSTFIQGFELDDWHSEAPLHSNSILLPALFAAVDHASKSNTSGSSSVYSGSDFLLAYLVGLEVGPRVGNSLHGPHMLTMGWHSGAVFGPAASSSAVSKLLHLPAGRIEDAIGIACTQACGLMSAQYESEVKRMQHGFAARNGLFAALMARSGYIGIKKVLERPYGGYLAVFGAGSGREPRYLVEEVTKELGSTWQSMSVRVKPYASMAGTHGTIDCVRKLQEEYPEQMKDYKSITGISYEMSEAAYHHGGWKAERPLTATGAQMSCSFVAATQIVDEQVLAAQFRHDKLTSDVVWDLVDKTTCVNTDAFPSGWTQRATITFEGKPTLVATVDCPRGISPPFTNEEIVTKWRDITKNVIDEVRRARIEEFCLGLDTLENVVELGRLMADITKNPIQ